MKKKKIQNMHSQQIMQVHGRMVFSGCFVIYLFILLCGSSLVESIGELKVRSEQVDGCSTQGIFCQLKSSQFYFT